MTTGRTNIILVGFMGTGKTTVGQILAARLGKSFVDMDDLIEERTGKTISAIFEDDGEAHFRELERKMAHELSLQDNIVVGAGGGIVLNPANIEAFNESGIVVCLTAAPEVIIERVSSDSHRPLLEDGEKRDQVLAILEARRELYGAIEHQVDTTNMDPPAVADKVEAHLVNDSGQGR